MIGRLTNGYSNGQRDTIRGAQNNGQLRDGAQNNAQIVPMATPMDHSNGDGAGRNSNGQLQRRWCRRRLEGVFALGPDHDALEEQDIAQALRESLLS